MSHRRKCCFTCLFYFVRSCDKRECVRTGRDVQDDLREVCHEHRFKYRFTPAQQRRLDQWMRGKES